jgi:endonuclease/exonuclease/phosphatase family metal-dependent hydrolase
MKRALLALALAACTDLRDQGGPWEMADTITGDLVPEVGPAPAALAPPSTLRVATWNVHFGKDVDTLAANLEASPVLSTADVVLIQEIEAYPEEAGSRTQRIAEQLGMTWFYAPARVEWNGTHGIAILSRYPLEQAMVRRLPYIDQPIKPRERNAQSVELVLGDQRLRIVNVHLDVRIGPVDRIRQLHPAVVELDGPTLLGGDFNSNPYAWVDSTVPLAGTQAIVGADQAAVLDDYFFEQDFAGAIPATVGTMRIPVVDIRIDNLYARDYEILDAGVEHIDGSDHWAVWFDVAM